MEIYRTVICTQVKLIITFKVLVQCPHFSPFRLHKFGSWHANVFCLLPSQSASGFWPYSLLPGLAISALVCLPRFRFLSLSSVKSISWRHLYLAFAHVQTIGYMGASFQISTFLTRSSLIFPLPHRSMLIFQLCAIMAIILQILQKVCRNIYTIIFHKSVCLSICRLSQTAGRNSCSIVSGDVSNWSYRLTVHPVTSSHLSSA